MYICYYIRDIYIYIGIYIYTFPSSQYMQATNAEIRAIRFALFDASLGKYWLIRATTLKETAQRTSIGSSKKNDNDCVDFSSPVSSSQGDSKKAKLGPQGICGVSPQWLLRYFPVSMRIEQN